jgi:hypothetical protein
MLTPLNTDQSLPSGYSPGPNAAAGTIRFLTVDDVRDLNSTNRMIGDLVARIELLEATINQIVTAVNNV